MIGVALLVLLAGGTDDQVVAALLHDTVEDCKPFGTITVELIREQFGENVATIVDDLTEPESNGTNLSKKMTFVARKAALVDSVACFSNNSLLAKAADLLHNSSERLADSRFYGQYIWGRFNGPRADTIVHFRALFTKIQGECSRRNLLLPLKDDLERVIGELEEDLRKDSVESLAPVDRTDV